MLAYTCFINANSAYYRHALDYFDEFIVKDNEDIVLLDVEFKTNNLIRYRLKLATYNTDIDADYILYEYSIKDLYIEDRLFKTKEELLKNL